MQILDFEQGSEDWILARLGIPTASEFKSVLASGRDGGASKTRRTYMLKLAGERITGKPADSFTNAHMERGKEMEAEAREAYAFISNVEPRQVGFIRNRAAGCSPDSLIGSDGMLEIKTKLPHLLIDVMLKGKLPSEHRAQCQGQLWVAEREWVDFVAYWPGIRPFIFREHRNETYITELANAVDRFNDELDAIVEQIRKGDAT